jgi:hypothetical protein
VSLFGEVMNPGNGRNNDAQNQHVARLVKRGALFVVALILVLIFFNYVAAITRIGAGYVGVEVVLSGSQRGPSEIPIRTGWVSIARCGARLLSFRRSCRR